MPLLVCQLDKNFLGLTLFENGQMAFARYVPISEEDYGSEINITITVTNNQNKATLTRNFTIKLGDASGITDVKEANMTTGKSYYTAAGAQLNGPQPGINIVRRRMADGSVSTVKIIK
jgi:hypothetical protein